MRRFVRLVSMILIFAVLLALGVGSFALEDQPKLAATTAPSAQDVADTRDFVRDVRAATNPSGLSDAVLRTNPTQLNSAIRLGARFVDGLRGQVAVDDGAVELAVSIPVQWWSGPKWLNLSGRVPEFDGAFTLSRATVGTTNIPPGFAIALVRHGGNLAFGNQLGDTVLNAADAMIVTGDELVFRLALDEMGKNGVMRGTFGAMRGAEMPSADTVDQYHLLIRAAMADGTLLQTGSLLPYLKFTLELALENDGPEPLSQRYTAAILGLAKVCGARDFSAIVGRLVFDQQNASRQWPTTCDNITFQGRVDSRRHFVTSAALQAASNTGFAISVGEFKELHDTISGAGGFDFTDLAANLSGIRLSDVFMSTDPADWQDRIGRLTTENAAIVPFDNIPQLMSGADFQAQFGDVKSAAYAAMVADIQGRIDQLPLYADK